MLYEYWVERYTPYSDYFEFWTEWLFKYFNEMPLVEAIESAYLMWKSEQHRMTAQYEIMRSLLLLVKHFVVSIEDDDNQLKIACQHCNGFGSCKVRSGELLYTNFIHAGLSTIELYPEDIDIENFYFRWAARTKYNACIRIIERS